jgi:hypothetical protein
MLTIGTRIHVTDDGRLVAKAAAELPAGDHDAVIVVDAPPAGGEFMIERFPVDHGPWDPDVSLRREDLYGDDGR